MDRRTFLIRSAMLAAGGLAVTMLPGVAEAAEMAEAAAKAAGDGSLRFDAELYHRFANPDSVYRPFVRWWWNGDKVEPEELRRELRVMKAAGIGGVEINPIGIAEEDNDMGKRSLTWLSDEWIEALKATFDEAKKLDMTCDLIVGSGWPFGGEFLKGDERAQVVLIDAQKLEGPTTFEISRFAIFSTVDPGVTVPFPGRTFELLALKLVPDPMDGLEGVIDLSDQLGNEVISVNVPDGKYVFYALVKVNAFASVINGAPGAAGPILNHMDKQAVNKYLHHMSDTIQAKTGPLSAHIRSMFTDSMELEGCNWATDILEEFKKRRGYDIFPYLPFMMFKVGRLGDVSDYNYGAAKTPEFTAEIRRMRYDFELTKAELLRERFNRTYLDWCKELGVLSRAQAYGRGFFPLESSIGYDIPEGESWTTNWLKHRLGEEMGNEDYRRGRGYTMINKFVSSAAHLTGKRVVSCEEMTNTYQVFNATLEFLKLGSDMSILSGITHSVLIGVNVSPPDIPFPGWVRYGAYFSEHNNWWPYMPYFTGYRARVSAALQNTDMYTDIALLPAYPDMWSEVGVKTEPFPDRLNVPYMTLVWEAIHKNGGGCDYTSEIVLGDSTVKNGKLCYGPKQYGTLFLLGLDSIRPETLAKLYDFVSQGGRVFCIEKIPHQSLGYHDYKQNDAKVQEWIGKLKQFPDRFVLLEKPADNDFIKWYADVQRQYGIEPYVKVENPDPFFTQNRYQGDNGEELFFLANSHLHNPYRGRIVFTDEITAGRYPWVWDMENGKRWRIELDKEGGYTLDMGPADSLVIVFDKNKKGPAWNPLPYEGPQSRTLTGWDVELHHSREGWTKTDRMEQPTDLKDTPWVDFTGTVTYRTTVDAGSKPGKMLLNLGKVYGVAELKVNGKDQGVRWYGRRVYDLSDALQPGENEIEVKVVTTMGNYMKTLTDNPTAQKWTNRKNKEQPTQSMGLQGPVTLYSAGK